MTDDFRNRLLLRRQEVQHELGLIEQLLQTGCRFTERERVWLDNPLQVWREVKEKTVMAGQPLRICLLKENGIIPRYGGYLMRMNGNRFAIVKWRAPRRVVSYAELLGLCLSGRLTVDDARWEMPTWYQQQYEALAKQNAF